MVTTSRLNGVETTRAMKAPCRVATTANITLAGLQTIDGVVLVANDRVLVKNQTTTTQNGIYVASSGNWSRATDFDGNTEVTHGTLVLVVLGSLNALSLWYESTAGDITIDTTAIVFTNIVLSIPTTGTSGHVIPFLDGNNTTSGNEIHSGSETFGGAVDLQKAVSLSGDITPTQIAADQNNYGPSGNATASVWRLSTDATRYLTGIQGGADGRILCINNVGSFPIGLKDESTSSTGANRLSLGGSEVVIESGLGALLIYDATSSRWRPLALPESPDYKRVSKTGNHTVLPSDHKKTIALSGNALNTLTFDAASGYPPNFWVRVRNDDVITASGRGKILAIDSGTNWVAYPGQSCMVWNQNNVWKDDRPARWRPPPSSTVTFNTDFTNGTDSKVTTDGLGTGSEAYKTVNFSLDRVCDLIDADGNTSGQTAVVIHMADNITDTTNVHFATHGLVGSQGGFPITVQGTTAAILTGGVDCYFIRSIRFKDVYIRTTGLTSNWGAQVYLDGVKFQNCGIRALNQGRVFQSGIIYFADNAVMSATQGILCQMGGQYDDQGQGISFLNNTTWTTAFLYAQTCSQIKIAGSIVTTGTITGSVAQVDSNSTANTGVIPGTFSAAVTTGGGTYNGFPVDFTLTGKIQLHKDTATPAGGTANAGLLLGSGGFAVLFGSGVPTCAAVQGSLYLRSDGSSTSTRLYVNNNGSTGWSAVTTAT